jgi:hypothetical protein
MEQGSDEWKRWMLGGRDSWEPFEVFGGSWGYGIASLDGRGATGG